MDTLYAVTSLGRVDEQKTLINLPPRIRERTLIIVQDHELRDYSRRWDGQCGGVLSLPPEIRTLGPTRRWLYEQARGAGRGAVVMLDDDLDFYIRRDPSDWHLTTPEPAELEQMFAEVERKLEDGYMHVGVSGREGNNRVDEYGVECTRYMRLLAYRTDHPEGIVHGRIDGMSDFDVNLQLLRAGHPSYVFFRYAQGQSGTQTPGGCSINRTLETHEREVDFMVREHAPHVKKRMKQNKGGGEFGTRPEVTIYWKRAHEEGARRCS